MALSRRMRMLINHFYISEETVHHRMRACQRPIKLHCGRMRQSGLAADSSLAADSGIAADSGFCGTATPRGMRTIKGELS